MSVKFDWRFLGSNNKRQARRYQSIMSVVLKDAEEAFTGRFYGDLPKNVLSYVMKVRVPV